MGSPLLGIVAQFAQYVQILCEDYRRLTGTICLVAMNDPRLSAINSQLKRFGLPDTWLASRLGVAHTTVARWLSGENAPRNKAVLNTALEALREYEETVKVTGDRQVRRVGLRVVPLYSGLNAGSPMGITSDVEYLELPDWGSDRTRWARVIIGLSMSPLLEPGDIVVFEDRPWETGNVVHAFDAGEDTVKVVRGHGTNVQLVPVNPDFEIMDGKRFSVKGVAVARIRQIARGHKQTEEWENGLSYRF